MIFNISNIQAEYSPRRLDNPAREIPADGTYTWQNPVTAGRLCYIEGPGDRAWMAEKDRNYVFRLLRESRVDTAEPHLNIEAPALHYALQLIEQERLKQEQEKQQLNDKTVAIVVPLAPPPGGGLAIDPMVTALGEMKIGDSATSPSELPIIPFSELTLGHHLGQGGFGVVCAAIWNGVTQVAVKQLIGQLTPELLEEFQRETEVHARLRHPNIIALYGVCIEATRYALVMEFMEKGSLCDVLKSPMDLPWSMRVNLALDMLSGILYLHTQNIIHRDLKSLNVLVNEHMHAKIADFGLAKIKHTTATLTAGGMGSLLWMAPELFNNGTCNKVTDIYATGIVLWEIASRKLPYGDKNNQIQIMMHVHGGGRELIPDDTPPKYAALISQCWEQRADKRPVIEAVAQEMKEIKLTY